MAIRERQRRIHGSIPMKTAVIIHRVDYLCTGCVNAKRFGDMFLIEVPAASGTDHTAHQNNDNAGQLNPLSDVFMICCSLRPDGMNHKQGPIENPTRGHKQSVSRQIPQQMPNAKSNDTQKYLTPKVSSFICSNSFRLDKIIISYRSA